MPQEIAPQARSSALAAVWATCLLALPARATGAEPATAATAAPTRREASFLIVNPAGRGNQGMADGFLAEFSRALQASWPADPPFPGFRGRYHVSVVDALASIRRERPLFGLVSPGFYLAHRRTLDLHPLLAPMRSDGDPVVHLLGRNDRVPSTNAPLRVGGQLAGEPDWLAAILAGQDVEGAGRAGFEFVPVARTLEAIRMGEKGELDRVALHDAEWRLLRRLGKADGWRVLATSGSLPEGPIVSFGRPDEVALAASAAMAGFAATDVGRAVLKRMTLSGFEPASAADWGEVARRVARSEDAP